MERVEARVAEAFTPVSSRREREPLLGCGNGRELRPSDAASLRAQAALKNDEVPGEPLEPTRRGPDPNETVRGPRPDHGQAVGFGEVQKALVAGLGRAERFRVKLGGE